MDNIAQLGYRANLDDIYESTFQRRVDPEQKISGDPYRLSWEFNISNDQINTHIRPDMVDLEIEISIHKADDSVLKSHIATGITVETNADKSGLVNNALYSYFSNQKVWLNNECVSESYGLFHLKAYIYSLLSVSKSSQNSLASCWGWYDDGDMNSTTPNDGLKARVDIACNSKKFRLRGPLLSELFNQTSPIIAGDIKVELTRNIFEKCVQTPLEGLKVAIHDICLWVGISKLKDEYANKLYTNLLGTPQPYYIQNSDLNYYRMKRDDTDFFQSITNKNMPQLVLIGFQDTETFNGKWTDNTFKFSDPGVSEIYLMNESVKFPLGIGYQFRSESDYTRAYKGLHDNCKLSSVSFPLKYYAENYFLLAFDLTDSFSYGKHYKHPFKSQNLKLFVKFKDKLTKPWTIFTVCYRDTTVFVNSLKQTIIEN